MLRFLILSTLFFASCGDCVQLARGTVVDQSTGKPLVGVSVNKVQRESYSITTDSLGRFELRGISGGLFHCPAMEVKIQKDGYQTVTIEIPSGKERKIELVRNP